MACYTRKEAKDLWEYAKNTYLKQPLSATRKNPTTGALEHVMVGYPDFKQLTHRLSDDIFKATGGKRRIVPEEIAKLIGQPKTIKTASKNLLLADKNRAQTLRQAKEFVTGTEKTTLARFAGALYQAPYVGKTAFHSAALHMTHAWPYAFDPAAWKNFGKTWVHAWSAMNESNARGISEGIMMDSNFDRKVNSGLAVDPRKIYDDVQERAGFWGKLGKMTANSFLGLKEFRSMQWDAMWDKVPDHLKTDEMASKISLHINHMTGAPGPEGARALGGKFGKILRGVAFAPSLDVARVMRPVDVVKSIGTEAQRHLNNAPVIGEHLQKLWGRTSAEQQFIARENMKGWVRIAGVYSGLLYLNHLALKHFFGSDEDVNVTDPFTGDWMAGKGPDGSVLQATGGQIPMARAAIHMVGKPKQAGSALGNYLMGKINPALQIPLTLATGKAFGGSDIPAPFGEQEASIGNYAAFLTAELGPIATEEGIREFTKQMNDQNGVEGDWNEKFLRSFKQAGLVTIPALAGTHYYKPKSPVRKMREE